MNETDNASHASDQDEATIEDFHQFQSASTAFSDSATELMAASIRMQMLMLDDTRSTLGEVAGMFAHSVRGQREKAAEEN